jgi:hypothetical protein
MKKIWILAGVLASFANVSFAGDTLRARKLDSDCFIIFEKDFSIPKNRTDWWAGDLSFTIVAASRKVRTLRKGARIKIEAFTSGILNTGNPNDGRDGWIPFEGLAFRTDPTMYSLETGNWRVESTRWLIDLPLADFAKHSDGILKAVCEPR